MCRAFFFSLLLCWIARAQTIQGTVLEATTHQPVRKAAVTLSALSADRSFAIAISDSAGVFTFTQIPKGRYSIIAERRGYLSIPYGAIAPQRGAAVLILTEAESRTGITLLLAQANSVSGTVTDLEGDGIAGVQITLHRKQWIRGKPQWRQVHNAITDSRGRYDARPIPNGEYLLVAQGQAAPVLRTRPVNIIGEAVPPESWVAQAYPAPVIVAGAAVAGIDFHLNSAPQVSIHGTVTGIPEDVRTVVYSLDSDLIPGSRNGNYRPLHPVPSFHIAGIPAGSYQLTIDAGSRRSTSKLNLTTADTNVNITLSPGTPLAGTVTFEGAGSAKLKTMQVNLSSADDRLPARADVEDGEFEFDEVPPGLWSIGVVPLPRDYFIKSMRLGTKDVLLGNLEIGPETKGPLTIVLSSAAPRVEGTVEPAEPSTVIAVPVAQFANVPSFFAASITDDRGHFTLRGMHPGTYRLYAVRDIEPESWHDPKVLLPFESQSKIVELGEGETKTLTLSLIGASHP